MSNLSSVEPRPGLASVPKVKAARMMAFAPFEWMIALRYLRARRASGFVSAIAIISFLGITVGVAALIIVMSVMNGFHKELLDKIVGVNGHIFLQAADTPLNDYDKVVAGREARARRRSGDSARRGRGRRLLDLQPGRRPGARHQGGRT